MFGLFSEVKGLLKLKKTFTDGSIFRLHTKVTVSFLLCACVLLSCRQYFGDPIHCLQNDVTRITVLETFCWNHATYILPETWNATVGLQVPHPGIGKSTAGKNKVYHAYYQWVSLVLMIQSILFYFPKYLWKCWENDTMKALMLNLHNPLMVEEYASKSVELVTSTLNLHWGYYGSYFRSYMYCELLSILNVIGQMFLLDRFLNGAFTTFGIRVIMWSEWNQEYRTDPLVQAFPRMTKCQFHEFGSSGDVQKYDALCLLPLNNFNEKIYIFLWFWMVFLFLVSAIGFVYRLLLMGMPMLRYCVIISKAPRTHKGALDIVLLNATIGDWFILYMLSQNIAPCHFQSVIGRLAEKIEEVDLGSVSATSSNAELALINDPIRSFIIS